MKIRNETSHQLLSMYLSGDSNISLNDIKRKEHVERVTYWTNKASFNKGWLKLAVLPLVLMFTFFFDSQN